MILCVHINDIIVGGESDVCDALDIKYTESKTNNKSNRSRIFRLAPPFSHNFAWVVFLLVAYTGLNVGFYKADLAGRGFLPTASVFFSLVHSLIPIGLVYRKYEDKTVLATCVAMQEGCSSSVHSLAPLSLLFSLLLFSSLFSKVVRKTFFSA